MEAMVIFCTLKSGSLSIRLTLKKTGFSTEVTGILTGLYSVHNQADFHLNRYE
jgi:hypothetical protein